MIRNCTNALIGLSLCLSADLSAQKIAGGGQFSAYICKDKSANAWGYNLAGQIGDNTATYKPTAVSVRNLTDAVAVVAGEDHVLYLKSDGTVWTTGNNFYGQLGDNTTGNHFLPAIVPGLTGIIAIAAGESHSLFLKNDGTVWSCGYNIDGQLGDGTNTRRMVPVQVNISGVKGIAAGGGLGGSHSLFLKTDGTVWSCGYGSDGQLGDGSTSSFGKKTPVQVTGLTGVTAVAAGGYHSLFLKSDGTVWACGRNDEGQLGDNSTTSRKNIVQVQGLSNIVAIAGGGYHSLFLNSSGAVYAAGYNKYGQLGDVTKVNKKVATQVTALTNVTDIAGGDIHSVFAKADGSVWACGEGDYGRLGQGEDDTDRSTPVQVPGTCIAGPGPTGLSHTINREGFSVFPIPSTGKFTFQTSQGASELVIFDNTGATILHKSLTESTEVDLSQYNCGVYFYKIISKTGSAASGRLIVER